MRGLWSEHFPTPEKPSQPPPPRDGYDRCLICPICNAACVLLISGSKKNPNRQYYKCRAHDHNFFKWADDVNPREFIDVPYCGGCNAGVCRVQKVKAEPDAGRILFTCTIKEGEGSCGYRVWQDEQEMQVTEASPSIATNCGESSSNANLVEGNLQKGEAADNESSAISTSQDLQCVGATSGKMEKEKGHEFSRRPPKRSRCGDLKAPDSLISACTLTMLLPTKSVSIQHCWMAAAIRQNLGTELQGWWGRLAFHPMPSLIIHGSCYVSSTAVDCACMVPNRSLVNSHSLSTVTRSLLEVGSSSELLVHKADLRADTRFFQVAQDVPLNRSHLSVTRFHNVMSDSISKAFGQAAVDVLTKFLCLLEMMGAQDHEAMSQAAKTTFVALDCLMFDHQDLREHVKKLIHCARALSKMEQQSIQRNDSYQKILDQCSTERLKLDKINSMYAEMVQNMASSKNHLKIMQEQISSIKSWLLEAEIKLSLYKVEMHNMDLQSGKIFEMKEVLEQNYVIAVKELEELQRLREHENTEHDVAKAAFDRARALLREYRRVK